MKDFIIPLLDIQNVFDKSQAFLQSTIVIKEAQWNVPLKVICLFIWNILQMLLHFWSKISIPPKCKAGYTLLPQLIFN